MKQIDDFLMDCEYFRHYETEEAYTNDLRKYIMYYWNMPVSDAANVVDEHTKEIHGAYQADLPIADLAQEITPEDDDDEDPEILSMLDNLFAHINEEKKAVTKNPAPKNVRLKSKINKISPFDYSAHLGDLPGTWIDPCDKTERKIRCVSDGAKERQWLASDQSIIADYDIDDITYYLDDVLEEGGLTAGKEYTLINAGIDYDVEMGLVWVKEVASENGIPAFLFEELKPVDVETRVKNWEQHFDDDEM